MVHRQSGASLLEVSAPSMAQQYCTGMRGVDIADQLRSSYCIRQKNKRWYMSLFYWIVDSAIVNAFACSQYHEFSDDFPFTTSHLSFRTAIIYGLIGYGLSVSSDRGVQVDNSTRTRINSIESLPATRVINALHLPLLKTKGRCQWCWIMKDEQHRTRYKCRECNINLCIDCFVPFHDFRP
jgi:Transposase IS4